jgi:hypothetical protein
MTESQKERAKELQLFEEKLKRKHPQLQPLIKQWSEIICSWPEVERSKHVYGGTEFRVFNRSIGHIHANGLIDLPFRKELRDLLIERGYAEWHTFKKDMLWVSVHLKKEEDFSKARPLLLLSYYIKAGEYLKEFPYAASFINNELNLHFKDKEILKLSGYLQSPNES